MFLTVNDYVSELRGYLLGLQRICKTRCVFHSEIIKLERGIDNTIECYVKKLSSDFDYFGKEVISYTDVQKIFRRYVISNIDITNANAIKLIEYDLVEYFGLCSTATDSDGSFNQLVSGGAIKLNFNLDTYKSCCYFFVPINSFVIVVGLAIN